uniref:Protein kinase domain-containing protein n=1 Tax=Panagrolaimus sp. ES5 TaxID=591445 RepID=A0AC34F8M1_9BILA
METLVGRFKKLLKPKKRKLPSFIEVDVDPKKYWNVLEDIGEGAFGAVKKVSRKDNPKLIAAYKCTEIEDGEEVEDLAIEVEILLSCKNEHVVGILAAYYHSNCLSVMLEYCAGGAVDNIMIELEKPLTEKQIAPIIRQVVQGLVFLHSKYVIHRDLKAGNILLTSDGIAKIADFGVSTVLSNPDDGSNTFIGTPHWMSPEVIRCETMTNIPYNSKTDIWSLGITCIEMAQKEPPYHDLSAERVRLRILRSANPPNLDRPDSIGSIFRDFISRCLVINAQERCSASDLINHPFIANATDRKDVKVLLLEMNADICEEPVFEPEPIELEPAFQRSGSCRGSVSSGGTSLWSKPEDSLNTSEEYDKVPDNDQTPMAEKPPVASKKKRVAPAPPPFVSESAPGDENKKDLKHFVSEVRENGLGDQNKFIKKEAVPPQGHLSPSRKEAMEILDDLNVMLDENYQQSPSGSRSSSRSSLNSPRRKSDKFTRPRLADSKPSHSSTDSLSNSNKRNQFEDSGLASTESGSTIVKCVTPTQSIREMARMYSLPNSKTPSPRLQRGSSFSSRSAKSDGTSHSANQPVRLQVNYDDDMEETKAVEKNVVKPRPRETSYSSDGSQSRNSVVADIPQGLLADHARDDAERIKEKRRKEDAALFGDQQTHVSDLAATFVTKVTEVPKVNNKPVLRQEVLRRQEQLEHRPLSEQLLPPPPVAAKPPRPVSESDKAKLPPQSFNYFNNDETKRLPKQLSEPEAPPEPPVDYEETPKASFQPRHASIPNDNGTPKIWSQRGHHLQKHNSVTVNGKENAEPRQKENLVRRTPSRQTATKKTRTYVVDGVQMTSTTVHEFNTKLQFEEKKEQEREYLRMQREEARQRAAQEKKSATLQEHQERQFIQEKYNLEKTYLGDIEMISKTQKKTMEDLERVHEDEIKALAKNLKSDQEKKIRIFKEQVAKENKALKQETDLIPKPQRKDIFRFKKEQMDKIHGERELMFLDQLDREHESVIDQIRSAHRDKVAVTERQFLEHKHKIEQSMLSAVWELEERQLKDRQNLNQQQFKELYSLQRSQMKARHQKEIECLRRNIQEKEDRLMRELSTNRKNRPKSLRSESKARIRMFKESLHIDYPQQPEKWDHLLAEFEEREKQRVKATIEEYEQKCKLRMDALIEENHQSLKEIESNHNDKRILLCENEQQVLAESEQHFQKLLNEARAKRPVKKAELERKFKDELEKQMKFYNISVPIS